MKVSFSDKDMTSWAQDGTLSGKLNLTSKWNTHEAKQAVVFVRGVFSYKILVREAAAEAEAARLVDVGVGQPLRPALVSADACAPVVGDDEHNPLVPIIALCSRLPRAVVSVQLCPQATPVLPYSAFGGTAA